MPYIGAQAVKLQLAVKQEELRKCQQELTLLNEKIKKSDSVLSLNSDKPSLRLWKGFFVRANGEQNFLTGFGSSGRGVENDVYVMTINWNGNKEVN